MNVCAYACACKHTNSYIHTYIAHKKAGATVVLACRNHERAHTARTRLLFETGRGPYVNCNTLQYTATHCNMLQRSAPQSFAHVMMWTATHCNTLQHTATRRTTLCTTLLRACPLFETGRDLYVNCNTLQHNATHCNTLHARFHALQYTATHCITLHTHACCSEKAKIYMWAATHCITVQHTATNYKTRPKIQHTATHCNTLHHAATCSITLHASACC